MTMYSDANVFIVSISYAIAGIKFEIIMARRFPAAGE